MAGLVDKPTPRIGLVLGAGGPVGHAFHAGVLHALADHTGWDPRTAEVIIGTSAGAQVAALLRAGMSPADLAARVTGAPLSPAGKVIAEHYTRPSHREPHPDHPRTFRPGSGGYLGRALLRPWRIRPAPLVAAMLPRGRASLMPQAAGLRRIFGDAWPSKHLWIPAMHLGTGQRVTFGHPETAHQVDVGTAVVSSGSVPGVWAPTQVGEDFFVDGGLASATNMDLVRDTAVDMILVSSPLSRFGAMKLMLRADLRRIGKLGVDVVMFEPDVSVRTAMGWNPMDPKRGKAVAETAYASTRRRLAEQHELDPIADLVRHRGSGPLHRPGDRSPP